MRTGKRDDESLALYARPAAPLIIFLSLVLLSAFVCGCGAAASGSPEAAVQRYLDSWAAGDWNAYKASVVVNGAPPSGENENAARQAFDAMEVKAENLEMKTEAGSGDSSKATVVLTSGTLSSTAEILGETKTSSIAIEKTDESERPRFQAVKIDGKWFVEVGSGGTL